MNRPTTRSPRRRQSSRTGRPARQAGPGRSGFTQFALAAVILVAAPTAVWAMSATDSGASDAASLAANAEFLTETKEAAHVQIANITVTGPAAAVTGAAGNAHPGSPNRVGSTDVPVRVYEPDTEAWATLVWAHGGSFVHGTPDWPEADGVSRRFAEAGVRVYSVDYVLASGTVKAPAPANDVAAVLAWAVAQHPGPVAVGGASAGGHLAVEAALRQADRATASGDASVRAADALLLEYPTLHRTQRADSAISAATESLPEQRRFGADRIAAMYDFYLGDARTAGSAEAPAVVVGELDASRLAQLPPTVMVNADADDLRASGEQFAEQLRAAGVPVALSLQPGTVHGYLNRPDESAQAGVDARQTVDHFLAELRRIVTAID